MRQEYNGETRQFYIPLIVDLSLAFLAALANSVEGLGLIFPFIGQQRQGRWDGRREGGREGCTLMRRVARSTVHLSVVHFYKCFNVTKRQANYGEIRVR